VLLRGHHGERKLKHTLPRPCTPCVRSSSVVPVASARAGMYAV